MAEPELPAGEYAIIEIMGHRTMVGRVEEIERFGTKLLQIEPLLGDKLLTPVMIGGASIYQFTPCSAATAAKNAPKEEYQLPPSVRAVIPSGFLPGPEGDPDVELESCGHPRNSFTCSTCMAF